MIFFWLFVSLVLVIFVAFPRSVGELLSSTFSASTLKSIMAGPVLSEYYSFFRWSYCYYRCIGWIAIL